MESGTGGWIHAETDGEAARGEEPGLDEDDGWPAPATGPSAGKRWGHGGIPGFSARVAAVVAVAAAAAGVAVGFFLVRGASLASVAAGATPAASAPAGAEQLQVALTGRVLAVSRTSITIDGAGPSVTAAVTAATTVTGRVHGIGGIRAGDEVTARLTGTAGELTATAIQDLASALPGQRAGAVRPG